MSEGALSTPGAESQQPVGRSPEQLIREAVSLAVVLGLALALAAVEGRVYLPWMRYASPLLLLVLGWWHKRRFAVAVRIVPAARGRVIFPLVFSLGLVALLWLPLDPLEMRDADRWVLFDIVHLVVLVPLAEEFYFRGLLLEHLRAGFGSIPAVLLCTVLFALLHQPSGGMLGAGVLSLAACALVLKSGSLGFAIQLHVAWNGLAEMSRPSFAGDPTSRWLWAGAASLIILRTRAEIT
ncbi:MAG: CPBP family intramembrane glutamic endopeptidase [Pirellulales bacterium]